MNFLLRGAGNMGACLLTMFLLSCSQSDSNVPIDAADVHGAETSVKNTSSRKDNALEALRQEILSKDNVVVISSGKRIVLDDRGRQDLVSVFVRTWPTARGDLYKADGTEDTGGWPSPIMVIDVYRHNEDDLENLIAQLLVFVKPVGKDQHVLQVIRCSLSIWLPEYRGIVFVLEDDLVPQWLWSKSELLRSDFKLVRREPVP